MFHISFVSLLLYVPCMQNFTHKKMHAYKAVAGGPLENFIYTIIVCNDTPLS